MAGPFPQLPALTAKQPGAALSLAVKRAAGGGPGRPSYARARALALQPDPRRHAQARRGLKGSASRQETPRPVLGSNHFIQRLRRKAEREKVILRPRPSRHLQEREQWVSGCAPARPFPPRRCRHGGPAQTVVRITRVSSLTRAFLECHHCRPPATHPAPWPRDPGIRTRAHNKQNLTFQPYSRRKTERGPATST